MLKRLPVLDIERPPLANIREWHIKVDGLVEAPARFCIGDIRAMESTEATSPIICVEGRDMWVKWVTRITFTEKEEQGYWEVRGYPAAAGIPDEKKMQYRL